MSSAVLKSQMARLDAIITRHADAEEAALKRADADFEEARRQRQREDAEARRQIAAVYDDGYRAFGVTVPEPADDEAPSRYRARLFNRLVRRLPEGHEWSRTRADDLPSGPAFDNIEQLIIEAAKAEGERPSAENLPQNGEMVARHRQDDMGAKTTEFFGTRSFIADITRPGRKVRCIVDRRTNQAIWGNPLPQAQ